MLLLSEGLGEGQSLLQGGGGCFAFPHKQLSAGKASWSKPTPIGTASFPAAAEEQACKVCSGAHLSIIHTQEVHANGKATCYSLTRAKKSIFLLLALAEQATNQPKEL